MTKRLQDHGSGTPLHQTLNPNQRSGGQTVSSGASPPIYVLHQSTHSVSPLTRKRDIGGGGAAAAAGGSKSRNISGGHDLDLRETVDNHSPNFATFSSVGSHAQSKPSSTTGTLVSKNNGGAATRNRGATGGGAGGDAAAIQNHFASQNLSATYSSGYSSSDNEMNMMRMANFVSSDGGFNTDESLSPGPGRKTSALLLQASPPHAAEKKAEKGGKFGGSLDATTTSSVAVPLFGGSSHLHSQQQQQANRNSVHITKVASSQLNSEHVGSGNVPASKLGSMTDQEIDDAADGIGKDMQKKKSLWRRMFSSSNKESVGRPSISGGKGLDEDDDEDGVGQKGSLKGMSGPAMVSGYLISACFLPFREVIGGFFSEIFAALEKKWQAFEEKYLVSFEELEDSDQEDDSDSSDVFDTGASAMAFHALSRPGLGTGSDREGSTKRRKPDDVAIEFILKYKDVDLTPDEEKNKPPLPPDTAKFNLLMTGFILLNTVYLALQTDMNVELCDARGTCCSKVENDRTCKSAQVGDIVQVKPIPALNAPVWYAIDVVFLVIFIAELWYRYSWHGKGIYRDPLTLFDGCIVFLGCLDTFILALAVPDSGGVLRVLTVLRTLRLIKLGRLLRLFPAMRDLLKVADALRASLPSVATVLLLFLMLIYFFGVVFTVVVGHKREIYAPYRKLSGWDWREFFGSSGTTMQTLIVLATRGEWARTIVRPVVDNQPELIILWLGFIMVTWYGLLNIVVAVIVAETLKLGKARHAHLETQKQIVRVDRMNELQEALKQIDEDYDGQITLQEYNSLLHHSRGDLGRRLEEVGIDLALTKELFEILDVNHRGSVRFEDFMGAALRLNSVDDAEAKDMYAYGRGTTDGNDGYSIVTLNEKLGLFEKTMTTGLDTVNTLLFYVDSKLYRGYADMVD
eukprot:g10407.t1